MTSKLFIDGAWTSGETVFDNVNPSDTSDRIGEYASASAAQVQAAVDAARTAAPSWKASGIQQRHDILKAVGDSLMARKAEIGRMLSREEGKTLPEGIGETGRAAQIFHFFAGEALRLAGDILPSTRPGLDVEVRREPVGTVAMITPWNFPIAIPAWKIAPAICYGNTVVLKPSEAAPASAHVLAELLQDAGLPAGVFNLVHGGGDVGRALVEAEGIDAITFTGSVATGGGIARIAGERLLPCQLEMGGKNPLVILDDANLDTAVACALNGAYFSTGQRCTASSRIIVTDGIHDAFVDALKTKIDALSVGHALDEGTQIGPVIHQAQLDKNREYLDIAASEGAQRVTGGEILERPTPGFFMKPALLIGTRNDMRINREEIFGPIASVIRVQDYDQALAVANDTEFGLSAGICTTALRSARAFRRDVEAGMVMINLPTAGVDYHVPFGGKKGSSFGPKEQGRNAAEFYTSLKTSYIGD